MYDKNQSHAKVVRYLVINAIGLKPEVLAVK